jgi:putative endonuclease
VSRRLRSLSWPFRRSDGDARHALGSRGERAAARFLRRRHHRIIARNYDCPAGEIDLITTQSETIVFVEVKTRSDEHGKDAGQTVAAGQRERIVRAAQYFLRKAHAESRPSRFDVVTVYFPSDGKPEIEHFEDAFGPKRR